jgi:hypothetical protein
MGYMMEYLMLLQKTPFLTFSWLRTLAMVAPLHGIAHGRHGGKDLLFWKRRYGKL